MQVFFLKKKTGLVNDNKGHYNDLNSLSGLITWEKDESDDKKINLINDIKDDFAIIDPVFNEDYMSKFSDFLKNLDKLEVVLSGKTYNDASVIKALQEKEKQR